MKNTKFKRVTSLLMAILMCLTAFVSLGTTTAFAASGEKASVYLIDYPRSGDATFGGDWGHGKLTYMNGWKASNHNKTGLRAIGSYSGQIAYCIEPGTAQNTGDVLTDKGENFFNDYSSEYNKTLSGDDVKLFIGRILHYGYNGGISTGWLSQNESDAKSIAHAYATQLLIWEVVVGERDEYFNHVSTGSYNAILDCVSASHPLRSKIMNYYNSIVSSVQSHTKVPSFCTKSTGSAKTTELEWNGSKYVATLTDSNGVLSNYTFKANDSGVKFAVNGNKLTVTMDTAPSSTLTITATKNYAVRKGVVVWSDGVYKPGTGIQDVVTYSQEVSDPVAGYLKIKVSYGSCQIVKTSEDGEIRGVKFNISGNGVNKNVITGTDGEIQVDNLMSGVYTVTEQTHEKYKPQESHKVTVIAGQAAKVTFNNKLKRGSLEVKKTAEDGFAKGLKFRLYGTSFSGIAVNEYAVTDQNGIAKFSDVLIGTGYTLEEVDTPVRYVIPDSQTVNIVWDKVTKTDFTNYLKKWKAEVTKHDSERASGTQGNATLGGAVYGVYKDNQLIKTYTTDASGHFTTDYYACGTDWSIREISPSEGYLLDPTIHYIDGKAENYTIEHNTLYPDVYEQVIKGNIAIIKHTDDGSTKIETPEAGATFNVYLKSAGSFDNARSIEKDVIVCDENGFGQTKMFPYGVYTVEQIKGATGKELMPAFDVFVNADGKVYRYLINNATFEALIEIVKKDIETGKVIHAAGIGFKVRDVASGKFIKQHINYPTPVDIDTYYTDVTGKLMLPEKLPYGQYEIIEVCVEHGYVLDNTPVPFTVDGSKTVVTIEKFNMAQKGTITVNKSGEVFYSVTEADGSYTPVYKTVGLNGSVFEIFADEDIVTLDGTVRAKQGEKVATIKTEDGSATTAPLYLGKYKICEKTASYGMVLNTEPKTVELTYAGENVSITQTSADFYNERQKATLNLKKQMDTDEIFNIGVNGEILSVQFGLYTAEVLTAADGKSIPKDALLETVICDKDGICEFNTDIPVGAKLYVKEIVTDSHYVLSDEKYPVAFAYAGQDTAQVDIAVNNGEAIKNSILYGTVSGLKIDRETEETITGARFGLFDGSTTDFTEENAILTAESDKNGVFTFEKIPYGNWLIKELQPAEDYLPNEEIYPVTVSENGQVIEITVVNDRIPEISTKATVCGEKVFFATEVTELTDTVSYKHLVPQKEYILKGVLMDKATEKPLLIDGKEIISETVFTPEASNGEATVTFEFDSKFIKTETEIVVFETLYTGDKELTTHSDIEDTEQTVKVYIPKISTTAAIGGEKQADAKGEITIEDTVSFENLTAGKEYVIKGILMDKSTGKPFKADGKEITAEAVFTPETSNGETVVSFTFNADGITTDTELVVFETLCRDGVEIAVHSDIEDNGQTVKIIAPKPPVPQTGDNSMLGFWIGLGAIALGGIVAFVIVYFKAKKDDDEQ